MAMQAEPAAEQRAAALTEELPSAEEVEKDVAEYSLPPEVRVATNLILLRVNVQTGGVLTLVPHMESEQYYYDAIIRFCSTEDMYETGPEFVRTKNASGCFGVSGFFGRS